jgi:hypothetical protein
MKRSLLTAMGIAALALAAPGMALAHHGHGRHHRGARAHAHHAKFRLVHIGSTADTPAATPTTTTTPTPPTPENAGTVASYTNGALTLTLGDGSTLSGKVTSETRIECVKATPSTPPTGTQDESPGDDSGQGDDQSRGDMSRQGDQGPGEGQQGDDEGDDDGSLSATTPEPLCDSSALVSGAVVRAAELRIGPGGTEFESVLLVR